MGLSFFSCHSFAARINTGRAARWQAGFFAEIPSPHGGTAFCRHGSEALRA